MTRASLLLALFTSSASGDWPHWRGPAGTGVAEGAAPRAWSQTDNLRWKTAVPGRGHSTPVVFGERIFLTTAVPTGAEGDPEVARADLEAEFHGGGGRQAEQAFRLLCLDRASGKLVWERTAMVATPHEGYHKTYGSFASISPVVDAERVVASFGSFGVFAYDHDGELLWKFDPGVRMTTRRQFGEGAAPILVDDVLVHPFDHEGDSFYVALDAGTGEPRWRVARDEPTTWATPLFVDGEDNGVVIASGTNRVRAYDIESGELVWECGGLGLNAIPIPIRYEDTVLVMSGYREPNLMAIELGGSGDLTGTDAVRWSTTKGLSYTASPVLHDGLLYCVMDRGLLSCFDAGSGAALYRETRLPRGTMCKASPVAAGGVLYVPTESGEVHMVALSPEFELLGTNTLEGESFIASPAIDRGDLYLRGISHLYCIGADAQ